MNEELKKYIENTKFDLSNSLDKIVFEIDLANKYAKSYHKYLRKKITKKQIEENRELVLKHIPIDLIESIEFFATLDLEYEKRHSEPYSKIKDTAWRGFWMNASGIDCALLINWIYSGIKYEKYQDKTLTFWYAQANPKVKRVPNAVRKAEELFEKYYKGIK